jgi:hypothetical protein
MAATASTPRAWLRMTTAARLLDVPRQRVDDIARAGNVQTRQLPGMRHREYCRADVERLAREHAPGLSPTAEQTATI